MNPVPDEPVPGNPLSGDSRSGFPPHADPLHADPLLDAEVRVDREAFALDARIRVSAGEVVALLGPNGAGKTTALRTLAGLTPLTGGQITLDSRRLDEPAAGTFVPAEKRSIGVVFQDYLLFPHLSALDNVAFGLRCHGASRAEARTRAAEWLGHVGLAEYAHAKPRRLSGGQAQRVALARALAIGPSLLLLDEPLAALDARTRMDTRTHLHQHLAEHPGATLLVTHDPLDALILADRLVIVEEGRIVQEGDAATITACPRTDYVARLVGLNLYRGTADGHTTTLPGGFALTTAESQQGDVFVAFPPTALALHPTQPVGSPRNTWQGTITGIQRHGDNLRVQLAGPIDAAADVTPAAAAQLRLAVGGRIWVALKAAETRAYPARES